MDEWMDEWTNGWMDEWTDEWTDGWMLNGQDGERQINNEKMDGLGLNF